MENNWFGNEMVWWKGVVEARKDPLFLGRCRVRIFGWHTQDKNDMPTENLPWALPSLPMDSGKNPVGLKEGDWVWGFFMDGQEAQQPIIAGFVPGIPEDAADPDTGYYDPTTDEDLANQPRPPSYNAIAPGAAGPAGGVFSNPDIIPGFGPAFGVLQEDFRLPGFKFDVTGDGVYDTQDAESLIRTARAGRQFAFASGPADGLENLPEEPLLEASRYPLADELNEPTTSRLARNEKIEQTIVAKKRAHLTTGSTASHESTGTGSDQAHETEGFSEPATPYAAVYPFNHVYESESGHIKEIDDTPNAERLHDFHRSGTFVEIHPDGTRVLKCVNKGYNIYYNDFFLHTDATGSIDAAKDLLLASGAVMNLTAGGDMNRDAGGDLNTLVGQNANTKIGRSAYIVVNQDVRILVKGDFNLDVEGHIKIRSKKNVLIDGVNIRTHAAKENVVSAAQIVSTVGRTYLGIGGVTDGDFIHANFADEAHRATPFPTGPKSHPTSPPESEIPEENDADNKDDEVASASKKAGFVLVGPLDDVWKPTSESDGKAVSLSFTPGPQILFEALPTGQLQNVDIQYKHLDESITTWAVTRPIHVPGTLIEVGTVAGIFEDGRTIVRWKRGGDEYPKQMFLKIGDNFYLIMESSVRHHAFFGGGYRGF